ncbi:hypothetical protein BSNK01_12270 [Bacillaceae bacterium]
MDEKVIPLEYTRCAGLGCKKRVKKSQDPNRRVLCRKCWHKEVEKAAKNGPVFAHFSSKGKRQLELIDSLEVFHSVYELERE